MPTGFLGPAARIWSEAGDVAGGVGSGEGTATPGSVGAGALGAAVDSWRVASRGPAMAPRIVQVPRPRRPGLAIESGMLAISLSLWRISRREKLRIAAVIGFSGSALGRTADSKHFSTSKGVTFGTLKDVSTVGVFLMFGLRVWRKASSQWNRSATNSQGVR